MHRTDNDPPVKDAKTITEIVNRALPTSEYRAQFGHLVKLRKPMKQIDEAIGLSDEVRGNSQQYVT